MRFFITLSFLLTCVFSTTAQADDHCLPESQMTQMMSLAGFTPLVGGRTGNIVLWFYTNLDTDEWMIHSVNLSTGEECHVVEGDNTLFMEPQSKKIKGEPA